MTIRFGHHCDVGMYMAETLTRNLELVDRWDGIPSDLGPLTVQTVAGPSRHVGAKGWPYELVSDHLPSAFDSWMSQAMNGVENAASP